MDKKLLSEELQRMTYLFNHERGVVISEQNPLDKPRELNVNLGVARGGVSYTGRKEKSATLGNDDGYFTKKLKNDFSGERWKQPFEDDKDTSSVDFLNKGKKQQLWDAFQKNVDRTLQNRVIIDELLKSDEQIALWDEILSEDMYFAADSIRYVKPRNWIKEVQFSRKTDKLEVPTVDLPPYVSIEDVGAPTSNYFQNNLSELTDAGKRDIEESYIEPILSAIAEGQKMAKFQGGCIHNLKIESSASRYRNTGRAENLTFLQLSQERNDSVYNYIIGRLNDIGITTNCGPETTIIRNPKGVNGDGTSGPNPPGGDNTYGAPHTKPSDYDKYKYTKVDLNVGLKFETTPPPAPVPLESTKYRLDVSGKTRGRLNWYWKWRFPKVPRGRLIKTGKKDCPAYG